MSTEKENKTFQKIGCFLWLVIIASFAVIGFFACSNSCTSSTGGISDGDILAAIDKVGAQKYPAGFNSKKIVKDVDNGNGSHALSIRADFVNSYGATMKDQDFHSDIVITGDSVSVKSLSKI